jgi:signal transduction histidine kinase
VRGRECAGVSSLGARLLALLLALVAVAVLAVGGSTYVGVLREVESLFDYQLRQMALSLRDQGEIEPRDAASLADPELDLVVQIWSADGRTVYSSRVPGALPSRAVPGFADVEVQGTAWRTFSVTTRSRVIQVAQPRAVRERQAAAAALRSVVPLLLLAPLLALAVVAVVNVSLRPMRRVARVAGERDAAALQPLPLDGLPDEAAPLVRAINGLLQRLAASLDAQRAFVADAAHELRSPLTALKLQLDVLRRAPDDAARRVAVEALAAGVERASRLVEQLLTLARSEPGAAAQHEDVDLVALARGVLADAATAASARDTRLELDAADAAVVVRGDRAALAVLLRNLVDNAVRYAPSGARVAVRVAQEAGAPRLDVDDSGPGMDEADRARAFDRFWRRDSSDATGSGLGLSIVRSVAERHGAQVSLGRSPLGGLRATVRFAA